ncbi:MAG: hypothetical protein ACW98Y_19900 [Candidatus Thorarchaeota archaeon]
MTGTSRVAILKQWRNYIVLLVILLLIPYSWMLPYSTTSSLLVLENMFYTLILDESLTIQNTAISLLSIINLILLIIPSVYFTYRRISQIENESIESLGFVIILLTMIVLTIISHTSWISDYQHDALASPTPNLDYLPGFVLLLLFFTVMVPIFTSKTNTRKHNPMNAQSGIRNKIKERMPRSAGGWLAFLLFLLPSGVSITSQDAIPFDSYGYLAFRVTASFYSTAFNILQFGEFTSFSMAFIFGGVVALYNLLISFLWNAILVVFALLYLKEKIPHRLLLLAGLVSIVPHLFIMISSILVFILGGSIIEFYIPLTLLQIGVFLLIRHENKTKGLDITEIIKKRSEFVKVPVAYILTSSIRRLSRGFRRDNKQHLTLTTEINKDEEEIH